MNSIKSIALGLSVLLGSAGTSYAQLNSNQERLFSRLGQLEDQREVHLETFRQAISSSQSVLRRRAALALGRIQKPASIDLLLSLLMDTNPQVRAESVFALGQLGWAQPMAGGREQEIANRLSQMATDSSELVRERLAEALGKLSLSEAPVRLSPFLDDQKAKVRSEALIGLFRARQILVARNPQHVNPELPADLMTRLLSLESDSNVLVQRGLAFLLWRLGDARGQAALIGLSSRNDTWVRVYAAYGLSKLNIPESTATLAGLQRDSRWHVRLIAVDALNKFAAFDRLDQRLARDSMWHVRAGFARATGSNPSADAQLVETLKRDSRSAVRADLYRSLANRLGLQSESLLTTAMADSSWPVRAAAIAASTNLGPGAAGFCQRYMNDRDVRVRLAVMDTVQRQPLAVVLPFVENAWRSANPSERSAAIEALLNRPEPEVLDRAWAMYNQSPQTEHAALRASLVEVIAGFNSEISSSYLRQILSDRSNLVAASASQALQQRGIAERRVDLALTYSPFVRDRFARDPILVFETNRGSIEIRLFPEAAPVHVANIVGFARRGFYDGKIFHRVVSNFVAQGGDPDLTGRGDVDFSLRAEINPIKYHRGSLGMPRGASFDSGSIQIFVNIIPTPHLDGQYTVFGEVNRGMDTVDQLEVGDKIRSASVRF